MKLPNLTQIIESVVIFIAVGSFLISYNNLHESAILMGIPPLLAIVFPLTIDMFLLAATLAILYSGQKCGNNAMSLGREGWLFLVLYTIASIAFNIHMAPDDWWSRAGFAMCPIGLCVALHFLMRILEIEMGGCQAPSETPEEEKEVPQLPTLQPYHEVELEIEPVACDLPSISIDTEKEYPVPELTENQRKVYEAYKEEPGMSKAEACRRTGLSYKTVSGHYNTLKKMGMIKDEN